MVVRSPGLVKGNAFKLGLFGSNCSGGLAFTTVAERWDATWDNNRNLADMADRVGIECIVPVARWKGFGGESNVNASSFETITWATGLLACTRRMTVFGTIHVQMIHPILAAKQIVTADHVGHGRLGVNIVCGWHREEFEMFRTEQYAHDARYLFAAEWWNVVTSLWERDGLFDHYGQYFSFTDLEAAPKPYGGTRPLMMNAGASPAGRDFAIRYSDLHFDYCRTPEDSIERVAESKRLAGQLGRRIQVWIPASVVCRPTQREADDFAQYCVDKADWEALEHQYRLYHAESGSKGRSPEENARNRQQDPARTVLGYGGSYSIRGTPDHVAQEFKRLRDAGFSGVAMGLVNYLRELPYFVQEVLPRLERMGIRRPAVA
jgi:alkanesulfonate monooxygenase SsuD/methylene tetrahydromethanopterin reductase-like flavin-dependent oxidoreductase (luciferase family)